MILNCRNNPMRKTVDKAEVRCGVRGDWHCCKENEGDLTSRTYRVTGQVGKNLLLTEFRQFWPLLGRHCS